MNTPIGYFIIPCYNEEDCLRSSFKALILKLEELIHSETISPQSRIVFVDDGSSDCTWDLISEFAKNDIVIGLKMSHNVGHQNVLLAGLTYSNHKCDFTITIDADLQQDINAFDKFILAYKNGADIVYGIRNSRNTDSFLKKITALCFYKIMNLMGTSVIENHADYRLLSDKACSSLLQYQESNMFLRGIVTQLGFKTENVYFDVFERKEGTSKYTSKKMIKFAIDGITSMSIAPLHYIAILGISVSGIGVLMILYFLLSWFLGNTIHGWTSILCSLWFLCGLILFSLGVCGEYIGKNYIESKKRPRFYIEEIVGGMSDEMYHM